MIDWDEKLIRQFPFKKNKKADQHYSSWNQKNLWIVTTRKNLTIIESKWQEWNKNRAKCLVILLSLKWYLSKTGILFSNIIYISLSIKIYFFNIIRLSIFQWASTTDGTHKWTTYRIEEMKYRKHQIPAKQTCHVDYNRHLQLESTYSAKEADVNSCLHLLRYPQIDFLYRLRMNVWWQNEFWWYGIKDENKTCIWKTFLSDATLSCNTCEKSLPTRSKRQSTVIRETIYGFEIQILAYTHEGS